MRPSVLIVDDDPGIRRLLTRELAPQFDVHVAGTAAEAVHVLATVAGFVAVVSDFDLGSGSTGLDLLLAVQERSPACARILVTGTPDARTDVRVAAVAEAVFGKPWPLGAIREHLMRRLPAA